MLFRSEATVTVTNTGSRAGAEVVQLYVHDVEASVKRPLKQLVAFRKVALEPGEAANIRFAVDAAALAYWSEQQREWVVEPGAFDVLIGNSSKNIWARGRFEVVAGQAG